MSMLTMFKKPKSDMSHGLYKYADVIDAGNIPTRFRYYRLNRKDIIGIEYISGLQDQRESYIIRTDSRYPFKKNNKIVIGDYTYSILSIYTQDQDSENGMFIKDGIFPPYVFLTLIR